MKKRFDRRLAAIMTALACLALAFAISAGAPDVRPAQPATPSDVERVAAEQDVVRQSGTDDEPAAAVDAADGGTDKTDDDAS